MRSLPRPSATALLVVAGVLAAQAYGTWLLIERERGHALADAGRTVVRSLAGATANINRGLLQTDALLSGLEALVAVPRNGGQERAAATGRSLRALADQSFLVRDLMVMAPDGRVLAAGLDATRRRPPRLHDNLVPAHGQGQPGVLVAGAPLRNPLTGEWSLYLGRSVRLDGDGPVLAAAELPLPNLAALVLPEEAAPGLRVTLEKADGRLLMSSPHDAVRIGQRLPSIASQLPTDGAWAIVTDRLGAEPGGTVVAAMAQTFYDGLVMVAQLPESDALAGWRERRRTILATSTGLALAFLLACAAGTLYLRARERGAAALSQSKRLLDQALESMSEGFVVYDAERRLVVANRRYAELFPHLADLLTPGVPFSRIAERAAAVMVPNGTEEERRAWIAWRLTAHKDQQTFEQALPNGRVVQSTQADLPDGGMVSVHRDVTATKQAEERLADAKEAAERAHRMKSEFLSNISHELRTPLNAIIGFAQVLEQGDSGGNEALRIEYARDIRASGEHLLTIINDVLDMSKLEAGAMLLHETECDLGRLVIGASGILREQARSAGVVLQIDTPDGPLPVRADERLMRQVVLNLVSNAIKFTDAGGTVRVGAARSEAGDARITVADTGVGVAPEHLPKIFQPFYQADSTVSRRRGGTGLGLPISLAIMRMHQGWLDVASAPGEGTTAVATLPAQRCLPATRPATPLTAPLTAGGPAA
ncbi:ATP-binding protein [Azospirillum sp.]|uniref:ATP-binding protein n=1 Tax=Azospirillum sp. TaxID=34012 RepID=UPI002D5674EE|nr:ATP-binding protein [Azospirillum sp.]HYD64959.1 ATP-binding protein [Azospirillum sp.]